jgi:uncharacterized protein YabN with tetrapyrrole methylase and pyrophosphatase domain
MIVSLVNFILRRDIFDPWLQTRTIDEWQEYLHNEEVELYMALQNNDKQNIREELGDMLHLIVCIAMKYSINFDDIIVAALIKLHRRCPHVLQNKCISLEQAYANWNKGREHA